MSGPGLPVSIVNACMRDGQGGSPTAVLDEAPLSDAGRRRIPAVLGTSHAVFISAHDHGVSLRFCTAEGDLPACGHGTMAALAVLADRAGRAEYQAAVHAAGQVFQGWAARRGCHIEAAFATASIALREPAPAEHALILPALGLDPEAPRSGTCVASLGRPRILVPVPSRPALAALAPDLGRLREACDRLGLLGSYVYSVPTADGRAAVARAIPIHPRRQRHAAQAERSVEPGTLVLDGDRHRELDHLRLI
jgi:trans-2,3-dihydro-3-hydroxyanthranilate isomerase